LISHEKSPDGCFESPIIVTINITGFVLGFHPLMALHVDLNFSHVRFESTHDLD